MDKRITEQPSRYDHLERMPVGELIADINRENRGVSDAIDRALPQIERLITAVVEKLRAGGRLFYCGCGTGGRLAILDTIEVQNTYTSPPEMIQAVFPGGVGDLLNTTESKEDDIDGGWRQLQEHGISRQDIVVGFSASGTTPFVLSTLRHCRAEGITTGSMVGNPDAPVSEQSDYPVVVLTGPEFVTGSTRMKGGTAQKMVLDMISTACMIRLGRVEGNRMVNAKVINRKLLDRAVRLFMERNPQYTDRREAEALLRKYGSVKKAEQTINRP
ncbi:N-acetylmuramic acid 6-phosphate etherase [Prevotella sp. KH2C16]|uniref:N-acetylmuramic acid 6-phosphate etherase n=1 Tax=Prevotella sp. KH2C16 TaxID=1855325 RepID=UPI0008E52C0E|nr:N-acetylmuramic acid 6-phosphate etherase [Prevotella sp. KH2C16]SFG18116.1 N-acetylmuramic acid 6-phosphate etherase [Prevotella sp. KH2C16]